MIDSIFAYAQIRARSKLISIKEQIFWRNYCKSFLSVNDDMMDDNNKSFIEEKPIDDEEKNTNEANVLMHLMSNKEHVLNLPLDLIPKYMCLNASLRESLNYKTLLKDAKIVANDSKRLNNRKQVDKKLSQHNVEVKQNVTKIVDKNNYLIHSLTKNYQSINTFISSNQRFQQNENQLINDINIDESVNDIIDWFIATLFVNELQTHFKHL